MTVKKRGWYFGADPNQDLEAQGLDWMLKRMLGSSHGKKMRRGDQWQSRLVANYLRRVDKFRELFLFCVHVLSGQPARGTEITSLRFRNGVANHRNVFVLDGRVMTVTSYHKSQAMLDMPKMVPRFLPWRLGQIAVIYLTHVRCSPSRCRCRCSTVKDGVTTSGRIRTARGRRRSSPTR
ncbi:unnamed protein product [Aureobasidium mustum]|uniref:Uncharacterized protein n=1 Tax=Aureobasidium mustum TaxID=2773714 RepID=A0A9N8PIC1_9PEZI|nr:unnamed protein product [Aureobasidium mustum]